MAVTCREAVTVTNAVFALFVRVRLQTAALIAMCLRTVCVYKQFVCVRLLASPPPDRFGPGLAPD